MIKLPKSSIFEELVPVDETDSFERILNNLLNPEQITTKTEIQRPLNLSKLYTFARWLENEKLEKSAQIVDSFIDIYLEYMVSNQRKSRKEIIQALTQMSKEDEKLGIRERLKRRAEGEE